MRAKSFLSGFFLACVFFASCATFQYRYYGLKLPDTCYEQGMLEGNQNHDGWPDLALTECKPGSEPNQKGPCVIQLSHEYFHMRDDLLSCQVALKSCQHGPAPIPSP